MNSNKKLKLRYLKDNLMVEIDNPTQAQLLEAVKVIPPGAVFVGRRIPACTINPQRYQFL